MKYIDEAYALLKSANLVSTTDELSTRYCLKAPSYIRSTKALKRDISIAALASLASRLHETGKSLKEAKHGNLLGVADELLAMSDRFWADVYRQSLIKRPQNRARS